MREALKRNPKMFVIRIVNSLKVSDKFLNKFVMSSKSVSLSAFLVTFATTK